MILVGVAIVLCHSKRVPVSRSILHSPVQTTVEYAWIAIHPKEPTSVSNTHRTPCALDLFSPLATVTRLAANVERYVFVLDHVPGQDIGNTSAAALPGSERRKRQGRQKTGRRGQETERTVFGGAW